MADSSTIEQRAVRERAVTLARRGWKDAEIARELNTSQANVKRWTRRAGLRTGGDLLE